MVAHEKRNSGQLFCTVPTRNDLALSSLIFSAQPTQKLGYPFRLYLAFTYIYAWKISNPHVPLLPGMTGTGLSMRCGARADSPRPARETRLLFSDFQCFFLMPPSALPCDQRKASGKRRAEAESP